MYNYSPHSKNDEKSHLELGLKLTKTIHTNTKLLGVGRGSLAWYGMCF